MRGHGGEKYFFEDIMTGLGSVSFNAEAVKDRDALMSRLKANASSGDCILVMARAIRLCQPWLEK